MTIIQKLLTIKIQNYNTNDIIKCPKCFSDCVFRDDGYNWLINNCDNDNCNIEFSIKYHINRTLFISINKAVLYIRFIKYFEINRYTIYSDYYNEKILLDLDNSYSSIILNNPEKLVDLLIFI